MPVKETASSVSEEKKFAAIREARRDVRQFGDPVLREKSQPIAQVDESVRALAERMKTLMVEAYGVGLAAPQMGVLKRLIVALDGEEVRVLINPVITHRGATCEMGDEGCLSVGEVIVPIERATEIEVDALNLEGEPVHFSASGFFARIIQHEIDHLDGVLIVDRAPKPERKEALRVLRTSLQS